MGKVLVNLGCGDRVVNPPGPGWTVVNHDRTRHGRHVAVAHDLNQRPWPWADNSITAVVAWQVLEHLQISLGESFDECWRILKPGGELTVNLPLWHFDTSNEGSLVARLRPRKGGVV